MGFRATMVPGDPHFSKAKVLKKFRFPGHNGPWDPPGVPRHNGPWGPIGAHMGPTWDTHGTHLAYVRRPCKPNCFLENISMPHPLRGRHFPCDLRDCSFQNNGPTTAQHPAHLILCIHPMRIHHMMSSLLRTFETLTIDYHKHHAPVHHCVYLTKSLVNVNSDPTKKVGHGENNQKDK